MRKDRSSEQLHPLDNALQVVLVQVGVLRLNVEDDGARGSGRATVTIVLSCGRHRATEQVAPECSNSRLGDNAFTTKHASERLPPLRPRHDRTFVSTDTD